MKLTLEEHRPSARQGPVSVASTPERGSVSGWRDELDEFYGTMKQFGGMEIDEILSHLSSFSARMSEVRGIIVRNEGRLSGNFRTKEVDPFLVECDRQYKIWSRQQAVRQHDWEMTREL